MSGNISARICLPYFLLISEPRKKTWSCLVWNENLKEHRNKETFSNYIRPKKNSFFMKYGWREKFSSGGRVSFFNRFSEDIFFFFYVYFAFSGSCFLFVLCWLFFEIKNVYSDTHSTMQAGKWQKTFYPADFRNQDKCVFWPQCR